MRQRVYKKAKGSPTALTSRQAKAHSALHTLEFIEQHYVKENENSVHILWTRILLHTREPMTNVYNWTVSFELPVRRITQCQRSSLKKDQALRIRTLIAKQMTDAEKLTITTIETSLTADLIDSGTYKLDDLKTLLATKSPVLRLHIVLRPASESCDICARVLATSRWILHPFPRPRAKAKQPHPLREFARVLNECGVAQNSIYSPSCRAPISTAYT